MAKYKTPEEIQVEQSVGGPNHLDGNPEVSTVLQVFQPDRGRDLLYQNPKFPFTFYPDRCFTTVNYHRARLNYPP